jgi:hypothetical protein
MGKKRHTVETIVAKLREAEVLMAKGQTMEEVVLQVDQARGYKELEQENLRLRKIIADLTIDNSILKEAARGNY